MHGMFLGFFFELFFHHLRFAATTTGTIATITITAIDTIIDIVKNTVDGFCAFEFAISEWCSLRLSNTIVSIIM